MECPHLVQSVQFGGNDVEANCTKDLPFVCAVCGSEKSTWLCLYCGAVHCGRYVAGHALQHHEENTQHCVCIDCENLAVFCYLCDEYVVNDTTNGQIEKIRRVTFRKDEHKENEENWNMSPSTTPSSRRANGSDNDNENENDNDSADALWKAEVVVRNLRPRTARKRLHSLDGTSGDNRPATKRRSSKITKEKKVVGLRNLGNTCFMNVVLQSFNNISHFCEYLTQMPCLEGIPFDEAPSHRGRIVTPGRAKEFMSDALLAEELRKVLLGLNLGGSNGQAISPECLFLVIWKVVPRFRGYQQQDAHEFLTYMLDRLHTELLQLLPRLGHEPLGLRGKQSIVTAVFGGTLLSVVHCMNCRTDSKTHEPFQDLSLDIPDRLQRRTKEQEEVCSLTYSLSRFFKVEELADSELYFCDNCMGKQRSTKRFWIHRLPNVLCLHIKRFRWCNSYRSKVDTQVDFPMKSLDMSPFTVRGVSGTKLGTSNSHLYDLAAVIVHHGSGAGTGHYTAFAVHDGQWFHFNDSSVRPATTDAVAKCKPYILFYVRKEFSIPPPL